jgi:hypothetical protein
MHKPKLSGILKKQVEDANNVIPTHFEFIPVGVENFIVRVVVEPDYIYGSYCKNYYVCLETINGFIYLAGNAENPSKNLGYFQNYSILKSDRATILKYLCDALYGDPDITQFLD